MVIGYFQRNRNAINNMGMQMSGKGNQSKSWFMSEPSISGKGKSKQNQRESKGTKMENKGAKGSCKGEKLELGQVDNEDRSWIHEEWSFDERNDGWSSDGWTDDGNGVEWREDCEQTHVVASSFSLESSGMGENEPGYTRVNALNFGPEGIGGGSFHDWIPDGEAWHIQGYDENGFHQVSGWKTHGCIRSVEQQRISLCISTSIKSCGDRVLRTTRLLCKTQRWLPDSDSQRN